MKELSLHILDIAQNSVKAGASEIEIRVDEQPERNRLDILIRDDGCGMDAEFLARVTDPFTTTRTTRTVGLGVPLFKQAALQTGGDFSIESAPGKGTRVEAEFVYDSIDRMPLGNMPLTFVTLLGSAPGIRWTLTHRRGERQYSFDSRTVEAEMGGLDYNAPEISAWLTEYFEEQQELLHGGNES